MSFIDNVLDSADLVQAIKLFAIVGRRYDPRALTPEVVQEKQEILT